LNLAAQVNTEDSGTATQARGRAEGSHEQNEGGRLLNEEVTEEDIAQVVASWTGIPVSRMLEGERRN